MTCHRSHSPLRADTRNLAVGSHGALVGRGRGDVRTFALYPVCDAVRSCSLLMVHPALGRVFTAHYARAASRRCGGSRCHKSSITSSTCTLGEVLMPTLSHHWRSSESCGMR